MTVGQPSIQIQGQGSVTADQLNTFIQTVNTVAVLRSFTGLLNQVIQLKGTALPGDGGQGFYYWNQTSIAADNGTSIIVPTGATVGAWILLANIITPVVFVPSGRLTLTSGTPAMPSSVLGATNVIYTPYKGNTAPIWSGTQWLPTTFPELNQLLSDNSLSPAAAVPSSLYDMFLWQSGGSVLCTRGPAWVSSISRGAGAGTTQLAMNNGFLSNQFSISNGPSAGAGLYVGTIATNAAGTVDYGLGGSGSGGVYCFIGVWNYYQRLIITPFVTDTEAQYTYSGAAVRAAGGSANNKIGFVCGLAEDGMSVDMNSDSFTTTAVGAALSTGIGIDSLSAFYQSVSALTPASGTIAELGTGISKSVLPQIGQHFVAMLEKSDGVNSCSFNTAANQSLSLMMSG